MTAPFTTAAAAIAAPAVTLSDVGVSFGATRALEGVTTTFPAGAITGLLGRNGSGKTTLLSLIASYRRPTTGGVQVAGRDPFENAELMEQICFIRERGDVLDDEKVADNFEFVARLRPAWDARYAAELADAFRVDTSKKVNQLSRGQASAVGAIIGLASRAPVTIFDEVYLGMDAAIRQRFYDLLLADYAENPRTIILSSHLISEIEPLLEHVVLLHEGGLVLAEETETLRQRGFTVVGPHERVVATTRGARVLRTRTLGPTTEATVLAGDSGDLRGSAAAAGLEIGGISIQDLVIHLTEEESR